MIERASPVQLRKALDLAHLFAKMGINFVPMPVANDEEHRAMVEQALAKLADLERVAESEEVPISRSTYGSKEACEAEHARRAAQVADKPADQPAEPKQ